MSTPPPSSFPDVEELVAEVLADAPALSTALVAVEPPPEFDGTQPAVLVNRRGGAWTGDLHVDMPLIELEVYGPTKAQAHVLANSARRVLLALMDQRLGGNYVSDVEEMDGPRWLPDYLYRAANRYVSVTRLSIDVH
ncbi:hypothetical protein ABTY20_04975 [Streptomyces sp. NPDC126497]|uniref:hypothetical protein n=1 Tax=Streptomyces sp. NPDC126497 TaxID=3155313 RepID=UPI003331898A